MSQVSMEDLRREYLGKCCFHSEGPYRGVIRFVGEMKHTTEENQVFPKLHKTSDIYVGVEWDHAERGRHSGVFKGKKYFECVKPNHGSFIRIGLVTVGCGFKDALLNKRYCKDDEQNNLSYKEVSFLPGNEPNLKFQIYGMDKIVRSFENIKQFESINLRGYGVRFDDAENEDVIPGVRSLNLSYNLFYDVDPVLSIIGKLNFLEELDVSENLFDDLSFDGRFFKKFDTLKILHMNRMKQFCFENAGHFKRFLRMFEQLSYISLTGNALSCLGEEIAVLSNLTCINLHANKFEAFGDLSVLAGLKKLTKLILSDNNFKDLPSLVREEVVFDSVKTLDLNNNHIYQLEYLAYVNRVFPSLERISILGTPLMFSPNGEGYKSTRNLLISIFEKVTYVNNAFIGAEERRNAEADAIKLYLKEYKIGLGDADKMRALKQTFPNIETLIEKHDVNVDEKNNDSSMSIKKTMIRLNVCTSDESKFVSVPKTVKLKVLMRFICHLFGLRSVKCLYVLSKKNSSEKNKVEYLDQDLEYNGLEDNDVVFVDLVDHHSPK